MDTLLDKDQAQNTAINSEPPQSDTDNQNRINTCKENAGLNKIEKWYETHYPSKDNSTVLELRKELNKKIKDMKAKNEYEKTMTTFDEIIKCDFNTNEGFKNFKFNGEWTTFPGGIDFKINVYHVGCIDVVNGTFECDAMIKLKYFDQKAKE